MGRGLPCESDYISENYYDELMIGILDYGPHQPQS